MGQGGAKSEHFMDVLRDLPKAAESAKRALGSPYLKRFRPRP